MTYAIQTAVILGKPHFAIGYNASRVCVQITDDVTRAKQFRSQKAAEAFLAKYADCGLGLTRTHAKIVEA